MFCSSPQSRTIPSTQALAVIFGTGAGIFYGTPFGHGLQCGNPVESFSAKYQPFVSQCGRITAIEGLSWTMCKYLPPPFFLPHPNHRPAGQSSFSSLIQFNTDHLFLFLFTYVMILPHSRSRCHRSRRHLRPHLQDHQAAIRHVRVPCRARRGQGGGQATSREGRV